MSLQNLPNLLGLFRIVGTPLLVVFILAGSVAGYVAAVVLLLLMAISDIVDGKIARRLNAVSPLGVFLDTTSDKIFVTAALIPMVERGLLSSWVAVLIIVRDFAVSGLRSYAAAEGVVISARPWGKQKLTITVTALIWCLVDATLRLVPIAAGSVLSYLALLASLWPVVIGLALVWTVGSGAEYFWNARGLLLGRARTGGADGPAGDGGG